MVFAEIINILVNIENLKIAKSRNFEFWSAASLQDATQTLGERHAGLEPPDAVVYGVLSAGGRTPAVADGGVAATRQPRAACPARPQSRRMPKLDRHMEQICQLVQNVSVFCLTGNALTFLFWGVVRSYFQTLRACL